MGLGLDAVLSRVQSSAGVCGMLKGRRWWLLFPLAVMWFMCTENK
jgi:hypothetical protein